MPTEHLSAAPDTYALLRGVIFAGLIIGFAGCERWWPAVHYGKRPWRRWLHHLSLSALNTALLWLIVPGGLALVANQTQHWDVMHLRVLPPTLAFVLTLILLDLTIYAQHMLFHAVPVLWRIHRVHHADHAIDVTTGVRFHPFEILLSAAIKLGVIVLLGATPAAVITFEIILNSTALFNHANIRISATIDRVLRWVVVTPDMHRTHHSLNRAQQQQNFGFNTPLWDRAFGSYNDSYGFNRGVGVVGLERRVAYLGDMLLLPFRRST